MIDIASRKVAIAGLTRSPDGPWMDQIARNLLDVETGFLLGKKYLLVDRDPLYTIKSECLDRIVPIGEGRLRRAVSEFVAHYHGERNHQGLENRLVDRAPKPANTNGRVLRRERLGGLLDYYERQAA